jgi:predicted methyltransferase
MQGRTLLVASLPILAIACGEPPPPAPPPPPPPPSATVSEPVAAPTTPPPPPAPPEPTAEEKKKAEDAKQLAADREKWQEQQKAEAARLTPEIRSAIKALAEKGYPNGKAAVQAMMASKHRRPANAARDAQRHPLETLELFGFQPTMTVLDIGPGEGWYTEIVAPAVAKKGKYVATSADPNGPADARPTFYANRWKGFLEGLPEAYGKAETLVVDGKAPKLGGKPTFDLVLLMRGVHGMKNAGTFDAWLAEIHAALKNGGVLGIEEHRSLDGANVDEVAKKGYMPEKWVVSTVEAAGFKLAGKSEVSANPKDTKDYVEGVWTLPPTLRLGDKDREKFLAIGESDRMTLKFVKIAKKDDAKKPDPKAPAPKAPAPKK